MPGSARWPRALQGMLKPVVGGDPWLLPGRRLRIRPDVRHPHLHRRCPHRRVPAVKLGLPYRLEDIIKVVDVVGPARAREMVLLGRQYGGRGDPAARPGAAPGRRPRGAGRGSGDGMRAGAGGECAAQPDGGENRLSGSHAP